MKYIIIEGEKFTRKSLCEIVSKFRPSYEMVASFINLEDSVKYLKENVPDLIFMDTEFTDGTHLDLFKKVEVQSPVIFISSNLSHALGAFRFYAIDYLLKPVRKNEIERAIKKLEAMRNLLNNGIYHRVFERQNNQERILITGNKTFSYLRYSEIAWLCVEDRYIMAYTYDGRCELTDIKNMEEAMTLLSKHDFFQLSRSVIANIEVVNQVQKISDGRLLVNLKAGENIREVIVSFQRRNEFLAWLGK